MKTARYISKLIQDSEPSKIVLLSGPRQVGKTTLTQSLFSDSVYLNWDSIEHRALLLDRAWSRQKPCVVFDELHKMPRWKAWLKGIYDTEKQNQRFVVTGSARLNTYRKVGDSLAGRFFSYTLHPFDIAEAKLLFPAEPNANIEDRILRVGGFPEPFLQDDESFYKRWRKSHLDIVLRQDLIDLKAVQEIAKIEVLIEHLRRSVGSPVSVNAISEDLHVSDNTVRAWLQLLEDLYVIFRVTPYSKNVKRAILKSPKVYFYDTPLVNAEGGSAYENLVANALHKQIDFLNDAGLGEYKLNYLRNRDDAEIDFLICKDQKPLLMLEVKTSDEHPTKHFKSFRQGLGEVKAVQLVRHTKDEKDYPSGISIRIGADWLSKIAQQF